MSAASTTWATVTSTAFWVTTAANAVMSVGMSIISSLLMNPTDSASRAEKLTLGSINQVTPIPIIYGRAMVNRPFWMNFSKDSFYATPIRKKSGGGIFGIGKKSTTVGYHYFASWELALCVGPITAIRDVYVSPGKRSMLTQVSVKTTFPDGEIQISRYKGKQDAESVVNDINSKSGYATIPENINGYIQLQPNPYYGCVAVLDPHANIPVSPNGSVIQLYDPGSGKADIDISEGGAVRVYSGGDSPTKDPGDYYYKSKYMRSDGTYQEATLTYPHICYASYNQYKVGATPNPTTHLYDIIRIPTNLPIYARGSYDTTNECYDLMNPASILFEALFTEDFGVGIPLDQCDLESFKYAADYFARRNKGMGLLLERKSDLMDFVNMVQSHCRIMLVPRNGKLTLKILGDPSENVTYISTKDAIKDSLSFVRKTSAETYNEVFFTFTNPEQLYNVMSASMIDCWQRQKSGSPKQQQVALEAFQSLSLAKSRAAEILRETAYPLCEFSLSLPKAYSYLEPGDLVQITLDDFGDNNYFHCMTRVGNISQSDSNGLNIKLGLIQDPMYVELVDNNPNTRLHASGGTVSDNFVGEVNPSDLYIASTSKYKDLLAGVCIEADPVARAYFDLGAKTVYSGNDTLLLVGGKDSGTLDSMDVVLQDSTEFFSLSESVHNCARLLDEVDGVTYTDRVKGFRIQCFSDEGVAEFLDLNKNTPEDLQELLVNNENFVMVGDEVLQIGKVEVLNADERILLCSDIIRNSYSSYMAPHIEGSAVICIGSSDNIQSNIINTDLPENISGETLMLPLTETGERFTGLNPLSSGFYNTQSGDLGITHKASSPMRPEIRDITNNVASIRPMKAGIAPGTNAWLAQTVDMSDITGIKVEYIDQAGHILSSQSYPIVIQSSWGTIPENTAVFIPANGDDVESNLIKLNLSIPNGCVSIRFKQVIGNTTGVEYGEYIVV